MQGKGLAMVLAILWLLSPLASSLRQAVYDRAAGTRVAWAAGAAASGGRAGVVPDAS